MHMLRGGLRFPSAFLVLLSVLSIRGYFCMMSVMRPTITLSYIHP